jgi:hypothetical protein
MFPWVQVGVWLLVVLVAGLVVFVAGLIWRDGFIRGWRAARVYPPVCPRCGYSLKGLSQCRCPECGTTYRIEELWQAAIIRSAAAPAERDPMLAAPAAQPMAEGPKTA